MQCAFLERLLTELTQDKLTCSDAKAAQQWIQAQNFPPTLSSDRSQPLCLSCLMGDTDVDDTT